MHITFDYLDAKPPVQLESKLQFALECCDEFSQMLKATALEDLEIEVKADTSLVTNLDRSIERKFRDRVAEMFPEDEVLGEEYGRPKGEADFCWVIDPIDGTAELASGTPTFGTVLGLLHKGLPVLGIFDHPLCSLRVHAALGMGAFRNGVAYKLSEPRSYPRLVLPPRESFLGAPIDIGDAVEKLRKEFPQERCLYTCLSMALAGTGSVDLSLEVGLQLWDFVAGPIILHEAGGEFRILNEWDDEDGNHRYQFLAGQPVLCQKAAGFFN